MSCTLEAIASTWDTYLQFFSRCALGHGCLSSGLLISSIGFGGVLLHSPRNPGLEPRRSAGGWRWPSGSWSPVKCFLRYGRTFRVARNEFACTRNNQKREHLATAAYARRDSIIKRGTRYS
jgi:hypothetical protein